MWKEGRKAPSTVKLLQHYRLHNPGPQDINIYLYRWRLAWNKLSFEEHTDPV